MTLTWLRVPTCVPIFLLRSSDPHCSLPALAVLISREAVECSGFLLQCSLYIQMQPDLFITDWSRVAFIISLLSGRALLWAWSIWNSNSPIVNSLDSFTTHFKRCLVNQPARCLCKISLSTCAKGKRPWAITPGVIKLDPGGPVSCRV